MSVTVSLIINEKLTSSLTLDPKNHFISEYSGNNEAFFVNELFCVNKNKNSTVFAGIYEAVQDELVFVLLVLCSFPVRLI